MDQCRRVSSYLRQSRKFRRKIDQRGSAIIETMPLIFTLLILVKVSFGFWGAVHTGILNSIASYNHALSTYGFRADLTYLRNGLIDSASDKNSNAFRAYRNKSDTSGAKYAYSRYHGVIDERSASSSGDDWFATGRSIGLDSYVAPGGSPSRLMTSDCPGCTEITKLDPLHSRNSQLYQETADQNKKWTQFVWIKTVYGICLTNKCNQ